MKTHLPQYHISRKKHPKMQAHIPSQCENPRDMTRIKQCVQQLSKFKYIKTCRPISWNLDIIQYIIAIFCSTRSAYIEIIQKLPTTMPRVVKETDGQKVSKHRKSGLTLK